MQTELSKSVRALSEELKKDPEYFRAWKDNIAMAFKDEYRRNKKKVKNLSDIHEIANNAATEFLNLMIKVG